MRKAPPSSLTTTERRREEDGKRAEEDRRRVESGTAPEIVAGPWFIHHWKTMGEGDNEMVWAIIRI